MNRADLFNEIEGTLSYFSQRIISRGKMNILDFHLHSENFYMHFLNMLYGWKLQNMNTIHQNAEGIDLIDHANKLIIQVSSTKTRVKIENSLNKDIIKKYSNYTFKFISIGDNADNLRKMVFSNPHNISFNPKEDIIDTSTILRDVSPLEVIKLQEIARFLNDEISTPRIEPIKFESGLATIIGILSKENLKESDSMSETIPFNIEEKIEYNNIEIAGMFIEDYKVHYHRLNKKYKEFDKSGRNKSLAVLQSIRKVYFDIQTKQKEVNSDILFFEILKETTNKVKKSGTSLSLSSEELDLCVGIIVVDAFIKCKIFKNPKGYNDVITK